MSLTYFHWNGCMHLHLALHLYVRHENLNGIPLRFRNSSKILWITSIESYVYKCLFVCFMHKLVWMFFLNGSKQHTRTRTPFRTFRRCEAWCEFYCRVDYVDWFSESADACRWLPSLGNSPVDCRLLLIPQNVLLKWLRTIRFCQISVVGTPISRPIAFW